MENAPFVGGKVVNLPWSYKPRGMALFKRHPLKSTGIFEVELAVIH